MPRQDDPTDDLFDESAEPVQDYGEEEAEESFALSDAVDAEIIMHRDAHFGERFAFMLDYYRKSGKGVNPELEIPRIEELAKIEESSGENLAGVLLSGADADRVARAREAYRKLRSAIDLANGKPTHASLLAELILTEEEEMEQEMQAILAAGPSIVPALIQLIQSDEYYDALFPGYGMAPSLAAHCLGKLGDERSIKALFESLGHGDFFHEDTICHALQEIGEPAKQFLLKVLHSRPLNDDNERAALALGYFSSDSAVAKACLEELQDKAVLGCEPLATYLVLACGGLESPQDRKTLQSLAASQEISSSLRRDIETIAKGWKKK